MYKGILTQVSIYNYSDRKNDFKNKKVLVRTFVIPFRTYIWISRLKRFDCAMGDNS